MQVVSGGGSAAMKIPRWIKVVAGDVLGAFAGIGAGILIGPGGAIVGGVIGGCAGSVLEAG